jgi:hypothetical protein
LVPVKFAGGKQIFPLKWHVVEFGSGFKVNVNFSAYSTQKHSLVSYDVNKETNAEYVNRGKVKNQKV